MISSRNKAWQNLDLAISQYDALAKNWTVAANTQRLNDIKAELDKFRLAQQEIEDISHTVNNHQCSSFLHTCGINLATKASITDTSDLPVIF
jgi:hypothetical protein